MSLKSETFYALQCDFPDCKTLWEGGSYVYYEDGPEISEAEEDGWCVNHYTNEAYCTVHTVEVSCPPETMARGIDDELYCEWCEDRATDTHLAPMPDTWENRLKVALERITTQAHSQLEWLERDVCGQFGKLGPRGPFSTQTTATLNRIHENTCRAWKPDITHQEIFDLRVGIKR